MKSVFACVLVGLAAFNASAAPTYDVGWVGGFGGFSFDDRPPNDAFRIAGYRVRFGAKIDSLTLIYRKPDGSFYDGEHHGGWGGQEHAVLLQPNEVITGFFTGIEDDVLACLQIQTNLSGLAFGGCRSGFTSGLLVPPGWRVNGIWGRSDQLLDALGLYAIDDPGPPATYDAGFSGGWGGAGFSDLPAEESTQIAAYRVRSGAKVDSISLIYRRADGTLYEGPHHGGWGGGEQTILLQPNEAITSLYTMMDGDVLGCLEIGTSLKNFGFFGNCLSGVTVGITPPAGYKLRGIYGRSGQLLDQLGARFGR